MRQKQNRPAARAATTKRDNIERGLIHYGYDTTPTPKNQFPQLANIAARRRELSDQREAIEQAIQHAKKPALIAYVSAHDGRCWPGWGER